MNKNQAFRVDTGRDQRIIRAGSERDRRINLGNHNETLLRTTERHAQRARPRERSTGSTGSAAACAEPVTPRQPNRPTAMLSSIAELQLTRADLTTARVRNNLAVLLKFLGRFDEAAALYERSLADVEAALGPEHPEVATVLHNIGGLAHAAGRPRAGEAAARRAVEIREAALGSDHPDTAADRAALAAILDATGRHQEASGTARAGARGVRARPGPGALRGRRDARKPRHHRRTPRTARTRREAPAPRARDQGAMARPRPPRTRADARHARRHLPTARRRRRRSALYERALGLLDGRAVGDHPHIAALNANLAALTAGARSPGRRHRHDAAATRREVNGPT